MRIGQYIQGKWLERVARTGVLVVYDPDKRYRDLCLSLREDGRVVVDASESSIEAREQAMKAFQQLAAPKDPISSLIVYVPAPRPLTDEAKQLDPYAVYTCCGSEFPEGDGDDYLSLCLKAKPDHATTLRRIFADNPDPPFAVIDQVGSGMNWPTLRALLGAESSRDILLALLAPNEVQLAALKTQEAWVGEARDLFKAALGLALKTRAKAWSGLAEELWRFLLYSEFVFDLPEALPASLHNVPQAPDSARPLIEDLCDSLRHDQRTRATYIDRAETIERELELPARCAGITDLGRRDTFPFEERTFFAQAVSALQTAHWDSVRGIIQRHAGSIWRGKGENQAQWALLQAALDLIDSSTTAERQLPDQARTQDTLIDFYLSQLQDVDRCQREFEQTVGDYLDSEGTMAGVIEPARTAYRRLVEKIQGFFIKHLETAGWPPTGRLANAEVFDQRVAPPLQVNGRRVAYLLIDALRYELGVALQQQVAADTPVRLEAAFAQLPTITAVGMASLLPGAGKQLILSNKNGDCVPLLGEIPVATVTQRMEWLRKHYGDRFAELPLNQFIRPKQAIPEIVHLLVLRSAAIDSHLEQNPEATLGLIHDTLKRIRFAIHKLKQLGFEELVIATDHGFFLNAQAEAGDVCAKPSGDWINVHERSLLGQGNADAHNFAIATDKLGIRGDFPRLAGPRSLAPYRAGLLYFHGGVSLQEAVVPVLTARLEAAKQPAVHKATVLLSYKNGAKRCTTRLPVIEVRLERTDLFSQEAGCGILLEAHDRKNHPVGEAKPGGPVDPATGVITLKPGDRVQVTLKLQLEFEGRFTVKALDPTTLAVYCSLDLETDYAV